MFDGPLSKTLFYIVGFCFFAETIFWFCLNTKMKKKRGGGKSKMKILLSCFHNLAHPDYKLTRPTKPKFSDMYQPSELQKHGELLFASGGALALGYAAFHFL